jgi:DNA repair photolyase
LIISASRRTDIPAFYTPWLINRIRAGFCTVPNPYNPAQVSYVSLAPQDVDVFAFSTRNPRPILPHLKEMDERGYRYYFLISILDYPRLIEHNTPPIESAIRAFQALSDTIGPEKVTWRYDPILFTKETGVQFHMETYQRIAQALRSYTYRSITSVHDDYKKARGRMHKMKEAGLEVIYYDGKPSENFETLMHFMVETADANGMQLTSCAEPIDLSAYGIQRGKCMDDDYIRRTFGIDVTAKKDPHMRDVCGCVVSKDIGMYDMCLFGCQYCYATTSFDRARANHAEHNPESPSLLGWHEAQPKIDPQMNLFSS